VHGMLCVIWCSVVGVCACEVWVLQGGLEGMDGPLDGVISRLGWGCGGGMGLELGGGQSGA
jgi:hypothetical protein